MLTDKHLSVTEGLCTNIDQTDDSVWSWFVKWWVKFFVSLYFQFALVSLCFNLIHEYRVVRWFLEKYLTRYITDAEVRKILFQQFGKKFEQTYVYKNRWFLALTALSVSGAVIGLKSLYNSYFKVKDDDRVLQSLSDYGIVPEPKEETTSQNVWQYPNTGITDAHFKPDNFKSEDQMDRSVVTNTVIVHMSKDGGDYKQITRGVVLGNDAILVNKHVICSCLMHMKIVFMSRKHNRTENVISISPEQVICMPDRDVAIIMTKSIPGIVTNLKHTLFRTLPTCVPSGHMDGFYLIKQESGNVIKHKVYNIIKTQMLYPNGDTYPVWRAFTKTSTESGDCGSPLFVSTSLGPLLLGVHSAVSVETDGYFTYATPIYETDFNYCSLRLS